MKSALSVLFVLTLSTQIAAAGEPIIEPAPSLDLPSSGGCSSAEGDIKFSAFQYQGGAAPPPGMLVREQTMLVNGFEWGHTKQFAGNEIADDVSWPLLVELVEQTLLVSNGGPMAGNVIFTAKMTVSHMTADVAPITRYVICQDSWSFAP